MGLTVGEVNHVEPLGARQVLELGQPQVDRLGCMPPGFRVSGKEN